MAEIEKISKQLILEIDLEQAFDNFWRRINEWWPKEYTWSQDQLKEIRMDGVLNGLCSEIGPHDFRCDWGRITEFSEGEVLAFKWQISLKREPIPKPEDASDVRIYFTNQDKSTVLNFEHFNFINHGESGEEYRQMMDSEYGWDYILKKFKAYCEKSR